MTNIPENFGYYGIITNPLCGYEKLAHLMVKHELPFIQLRMKDEPPQEVEKMAKKLKIIISGSKSKFIINDYPAIARDVDADGVHIGQGDISYEKARTIVGKDKIIGISTHTPLQTEKACALSPDYIGIGPVFATPTKKIADIPIGISGMREMLALATVPAVVLGSITPDNLPEILAGGAKNYSVVRPVCATENPEENIGKLIQIWEDFYSITSGS